MERVKGIEPSYSAWKAAALPLSYTRAQALRAFVRRGAAEGAVSRRSGARKSMRGDPHPAGPSRRMGLLWGALWSATFSHKGEGERPCWRGQENATMTA